VKTIKLDSVIELDQETDSLFERIAGTEGEIFDPQALRAAIPDSEQFVIYLKRRNLADTPAAKVILAQLGSGVVKKPAVRDLAARFKTKEREIRAHVFAARRGSKWAGVKAHRKSRMGRNPLTGEAIKIKAKTARKKTSKAKKRKSSKKT
jgi:hypothetical protein